MMVVDCPARCELVDVSDAGQSFPSSSRPDDIDYGISEWEPIARRRVDDMNERRVHEAAGMNLPCSSRTTLQQGVGTGRSKIYRTDSARTLLKEYFAANPQVQLDPHTANN